MYICVCIYIYIYIPEAPRTSQDEGGRPEKGRRESKKRRCNFLKGSLEYANLDADEPQIHILMTVYNAEQACKITFTKDSNMLGKTPQK